MPGKIWDNEITNGKSLLCNFLTQKWLFVM